jgi:hypothetical protein
MKARSVLVGISVLVYVVTLALHAQQPAGDGPRFVNGTSLVRPADYREWTFLGSSLGLTYLAPANAQAAPSFGNVFVNPSSYRSFMQTGKWPNATMFVLEIRRSSSDGAIIKNGRFQSDLVALEAEVKDARFAEGWAYFSWGSVRALKDMAEPAPATAANPGEETCVECHTKHTAVERTFVQFYPTLLEVARQMGTLKPGF